MPIHFARRLTGAQRSAQAVRQLGVTLAFVAGATNAGGFLAVQQYTSHMTGIVSAMADHLVLGAHHLVLVGAGALLAFLGGAVFSTVMVNFGRRRGMHSKYAVPLLVESALLIAFGLVGARLADMPGSVVPATALLLCFIMGLQNALITKMSNAEIRTTHVTGLVTDLGIELGRWIYWNSPRAGAGRVLASRARLRILSAMLLSFFVGGVAGAYGFSTAGYKSTVPLALVLMMLAIVPTADDLARALRRQPGRA